MNTTIHLKIKTNLHIEVCSTKENSPRCQQFQKIITKRSGEMPQLPYIIALTEKKTGEPISVWQNSEPHDSTENLFFYLEQISEVNFQNLLMLLTFAFSPGESPKMENAFQFPQNYPSTVAMEILKETYGRILYHHQLENLIRCCTPLLSPAVHYRKGLNRKETQCIQTLESLYFPDDVPLKLVLNHYMPLGNPKTQITTGLVVAPPFAEAYKLHKKIKKWV